LSLQVKGTRAELIGHMTSDTLTVGNVHGAADASVLVEENNSADDLANFPQRLEPVVAFKRREVLEVVLGHDGAERVCDFSDDLSGKGKTKSLVLRAE
jgi:hypothetical protein